MTISLGVDDDAVLIEEYCFDLSHSSLHLIKDLTGFRGRPISLRYVLLNPH
jgi:hypothetical protein